MMSRMAERRAGRAVRRAGSRHPGGAAACCLRRSPRVGRSRQTRSPTSVQLKQKAEQEDDQGGEEEAARADKTPGLEPSQAPVKVKVTSCKERGKQGSSSRASTAPGTPTVSCPGRVLLRMQRRRRRSTRRRRRREGQATARTCEEIQAPLLADPARRHLRLLRGLHQDPRPVRRRLAGGQRRRTSSARGSPGPCSSRRRSTPLRRAGIGPTSTTFYAQALAAGPAADLHLPQRALLGGAAAVCRKRARTRPHPSHYDEYAFAAAQIAKRYPQALRDRDLVRAQQRELLGPAARPGGVLDPRRRRRPTRSTPSPATRHPGLHRRARTGRSAERRTSTRVRDVPLRRRSMPAAFSTPTRSPSTR